MSVRAYRVISTKLARESSFNIWNSGAVMSWLQGHTEFDQTNEISVEELSALIDYLESISSPSAQDKGDWQSLKKDLAWAKRYHRDYIQYHSF
jgi:hypothetical protein